MKRIGILTFSYAVNPGSILQAYGLWKTICQFGSDVECFIINYQSSAVKELHVKKPQDYSIKGWFMWLIQKIWYYRYQRFWRCEPTALKPRHQIGEKDLKSIIEAREFDYIVSGSDQVWNTVLTKKDYNYFLPFNHCKKISYAASIGMDDFPEEEKKVIGNYLRSFSAISVREPNGICAIKKLIGVSPILSVDPSLLLPKSSYEKFAKKTGVKKGYIFVYLIHRGNNLVRCAEKMAETLGLQLVECHSGIKKLSKKSIIISRPNPQKWIGLIKNAEFVFTDSFHGCAFCINLNKPFYVAISSNNSVMSSRIYNILNRCEMTDRLITDQSDLMAMREMSFEYSNKMLEQDRQDAIAYLKSALDLNE